jgi:acyl phosphate:glycerol-3-phosphate acyltransferase
LEYLAAIIGGYALGSIPFGLLLTRAAGLGDIRSIGSGNIGATNVLRTGNKGIALATLFLDAAKAMLALVLARHFTGSVEVGFVAGACALLGHCFPVWLKFKGGKGVATFFGTVLVGLWPVGVVAAVLWLATAFIFRYSSLGGLPRGDRLHCGHVRHAVVAPPRQHRPPARRNRRQDRPEGLTPGHT